MPKRGERVPYRIEFQYPGQGKNRHVKSSKDSAQAEGIEIARRGATVRVFHVDPDSQKETDLAVYDENNPPPPKDDDEDLWQ